MVDQTGARPGRLLRRGTIDAATLISLLVMLLLLIPARLIVPGMTDLGRPALLLGFMLFCWWMLSRCNQGLVTRGRQPLRWVFLLFMAELLISYEIGFMRGLTTIEANAADRCLMFFGVFFGVAMAAADGIATWDRLRMVLFVLVCCGAFASVIAIVQYTTNVDVTQYMTIPGLQAKGWTPTFEARGGGLRVASTASHYIELAATLASIVPFAVHIACFDRSRNRRLAAGLAAMLLAVGVMTTISRTGILALAIVMAVLFAMWGWRRRYNVIALLCCGAAGLAAASPGIVKTMLHLFDDPDSNPAFTVRQGRYPLAFRYVAERPWFGRGTGTWVAPQYQILDNEWLAWLITNGIVGIVALAGLHIAGIALSWRSMRRSQDPEIRHLCAGVMSTQIVALVVAGTFDSLSFMTYATVLGLQLGLCGAVWRLANTSPSASILTGR